MLDVPALDDSARDDPSPDGPAAARPARAGAAPAGGLPWDRCAAPLPLRPSQTEVLDALDALRAAGTSRTYAVLPAGTGKTLLGLESARRQQRRTLVLVPSTAVQGQWLRTWAEFGGTSGHPLPASTDPGLGAAVTVLTWSALSAWDRGADDEDVQDDTGAAVAERRRAAVRGVPGADVLSLLHPAGRDLVERAAASGPWTLVLDECAHLLETWGLLVPALVAALGPETAVLGLSATPAAALGERAREVHTQVFAQPDVAVPLPVAVARGEVAPYEELVHLTRPTPEEDAAVAADRARFAALRDELLQARAGTLPFSDWLAQRLEERRAPDGTGPRAWRDLEQAEPALARAGLRAVSAGWAPLPAGARLREEHRVPPDAQDWAALLGAYALEHLRGSGAPQDARLLGELTQVLPTLGAALTGRGLRSTGSPVDRVCALSASKAAGARRVLAQELSARGADLRALVVCDFEQRPASGGGRGERGTAAPGSAGAVFAALAGDELAEVLRPVLCTGRTVALRRDDLAAFRAFAPHRLADRLVAEPFAGQRSLVSVTTGEGWTAATWVPLLTAWLAAGGTRAVVSTRSLLGEGWDCPSLGVVVDLTTAAGAAATASVRGRALRRDPARHEKVARTWTVVCVADDHPRGGVDHLRAVRAHETHLAPAQDGALEAGPGHLDDALSPYAAPSPELRDAVNARSLARAADPARVRRTWTAAAGDDGAEQTVLRVRTGAPLGLPAGVVPPALLHVSRTLGASVPAPLPRPQRRARLWPVPVAAAVVTSSAATVVESAAVGAGSGLLTGVLLGGAVAGSRWSTQSRALRRAPQDGDAAVLRTLGQAVADALHASAGTSRGASAVRVARRSDSEVEVRLAAPAQESRLFATCLDELLAPLAEPRWLVSRLVLPVPAGPSESRRLALARAVGRPVDAAVTWHAVPAELARTKARVDAFDAAWARHLGAGRLVLASDPEGSALVELLRGQDPFAVTTRPRTVWAPLASTQ